ncbi:uncharacterized protein LOC119729873 [Patiria miniata]|uniref:C2H2-type domain-containing protein n=1 Tax=Patiria miniata TaxID=46514 RepID=A0A914A5A9_PATMI|nr:uncharacterized protein LOC119729873 [Patiria miniata]
MMPPNKGINAASYYQGLIDARVPAKENSVRKISDNSHFYSARVRYALEMASMFSSQAIVYSADNKNKIKVGEQTLAVDRRLKISKFFPTQDAPNYSDHDFPTPGHLIVPSGYLRMQPSTLTTKDDLGRDHFMLPEKNQATVILRSPNSPCSVASHMNDIVGELGLAEDVSSGRSLMVLLVDGGADFNVNHTVNEIYYARLFRDSNLDALVVTSYCPGDSALNPIERVWAPCTRALTSVSLSANSDGDLPLAQEDLTPEEKKHRIFNNAMTAIKDTYWSGVTFAGKPIKTVMLASGSLEQPYSYEEYRQTHVAVSGSAKRLKEDEKSHQDYLFAMQHIDRRIGMCTFTKCNESTCRHCKSHPPVAKEMLACVRSFPSPKPSTNNPGHFMTFTEALHSRSIPPCENLPLFRQKGLGRCQVSSCKYVFTSKKDKDDHRIRNHPRHHSS